MAILHVFSVGYIVVRGVSRLVPTNIQGLDIEIDVANFGSRFVPTYRREILTSIRSNRTTLRRGY